LCGAAAIATAVEVSDVAMRFVTEVEMCHPHSPPPNIACGYCEPEPEHISPITGKDKECMEL